MLTTKYVTTVKNERHLKNQCRKIDNEYYKIGDRNVENSGDCYEINGRYYKDNTGYILYDNFTKQYEIANSSHLKGVINIKNNTLIIGRFSKNNLCTKLIEKDSSKIFYVMNYNILENSNYILDKVHNIYRHFTNINILNLLNYKKLDYGYKQSLNYNITSDLISQVKQEYIDHLHQLKEYSYTYGIKKYIKGLSFGAEFETSKGVIPKKYCLANALVPLRDGSIKGLEYVTLPLEGEKGINALINSSKLINNYTTYDDSCSFHLHLGNIPRTESFILALFKTAMLIQDEMFEMFPLYKKENLEYKKKNYTSPLPSSKLFSLLDPVIDKNNLKENFSIIFKYLSDGYDYLEYNKDLKNVHSHPFDPNNTRKWNIKSRYHWINFVPLLFGNKETVEFRIHTPVKDPNKIIYFLLLTSKIVNFVKENEKSILNNDFIKSNNLNLVSIIKNNLKDNDFMDKFINSNLYNYCYSRKNFTKKCNKNKNYNYDEKEYKFSGKLDFDREINTHMLKKVNKDDKFEQEIKLNDLNSSFTTLLDSQRTAINTYENHRASTSNNF